MTKPTKKLEALMKEPAFAVAMCALAFVLIEGPPEKKTVVPGLGGRRNAAWRGRGSFGKGPFGPQIGHK